MSLRSRIACFLFRKDCDPQPMASSDNLITALRASIQATTAIKHEIRDMRESGIWPQDLIRGTYRVNRRKVSHDQHS